ncbi:hypothetical protein Ngar_c09600 [Candidatus Nitrososphaera gargensis Ga9.2]|uniref:Uncharacterized protein n=1 Tax=Nitrososphaera gargensis (strain Ga9.2) TaxID=1237085 RepID=K0IIJ8_NITGG|nr:PEFG-CTERM sorting domain-containing protein [Candidatus Nitrososphaera gargensis]AFU57902.1 hypothetical protein Ngar_c09600 [Candidatus Nitrososphaera gargensis Ga9.2]
MQYPKLAKHKQLLGVIIAAVLLTVIFVPFQKANAFTVTTTLPNAVGGAINNSVSGENFQITINVEAGELISIQSITLILDNGLASVKTATFNSAGTRTGGSDTLVIGNQLTISSFTANGGYGYGYGLVSSGYSFTSPYTYAFNNYGYGYIGGNTGGYANAGVTNFVNGLIGPGQITITGKLRTADLDTATPHTLDVLIDTGAGGNNNDQLVAPQLGFNVNANNNLVSVSVNVSANTPVGVTVPSTGDKVSISFGGSASGAVVVEKKTLSAINSQFPGAFTSVGSSTASFNVGSSTANTIGEVFEFDLSATSYSGSVRVTVPYNSALLSSGQSPSIFKWTGSAWEQGTNVSSNSTHVTGTFTSLSPVVAGALTPASSGGGSSSGGGGGGRGPVIISPDGTTPTTEPIPQEGDGSGGGGTGAVQWQTFSLDVEGTSYNIQYNITNGSVEDMMLDIDNRRLVVSVTSTNEDGNLKLRLPREVIDSKSGADGKSGTDQPFTVFLGDGTAATSEEGTPTATIRQISINFPAGTEEIQILGTFAVPEFGGIAAIILALSIVGIIIATARYATRNNRFSSFRGRL